MSARGTGPGRDGSGNGADGDGRGRDVGELALLDALAAEQVLGTLAGGEALLFARLLERDEIARTLVVGWESRLQGLAEALTPVAPPSGLRARVLEAVRRADAEAADAVRARRVPDGPLDGPSPPPPARQVDIDLVDRRPVPSPTPVAAPVPAPVAPAGPGPFGPSPAPASAPPRRVVVEHRDDAANDSGWRAGAIAASVIAASLVALLLGQVRGVPGDGGATDVAAVAPPASEPSATAEAPTALSLLRDSEGRPRYLVEIDQSDSSVRITALDAEPVAQDASLQLWMADGASGELRAIGLLPSDPWSSLRFESVPLVENEPAFAVSEEPPGGSPEAGPTGSVVFQGTVHPLGDAGR